MGMYTQLVFTCDLRRDTPTYITGTLEKLVNGEEISEVPSHEFFGCERYQMLFGGDSADFGGESVCKFNRSTLGLTIVSNLKDYDWEISRFIDWIIPYVRQGAGERDFLGYFIYEESDKPTLIYMDKLEGKFDSRKEHWDTEETPVLSQKEANT